MPQWPKLQIRSHFSSAVRRPGKAGLLMGLARFILRVAIVNTIPAAIRSHRVTTILTSTNRRASTVSVALRSRWIDADLTRRHRYGAISSLPPNPERDRNLACSPARGPFLNDPTLRAGDVVVTTKGFMMFRGEESQSHRQTDFVIIANASGLAANKKTLISLERASHLTPPKQLGAEARRRMRNPAPEVASSASVKPPHAGR